jgi:hypothetical protein
MMSRDARRRSGQGADSPAPLRVESTGTVELGGYAEPEVTERGP